AIDLTLAKMPETQQQAKADQPSSEQTAGVPYLGLQLAPANEVDGAGDQGVIVMSLDPDGPAAERGVKTGDVILSVGGNDVSNPRDVRNALSNAKSHGKKDVLLRVKSADVTRFIAMPIG
ncbi:MAG TPA: PDZ domain-containing protein, partial [Xanthobacteraceae bacterium]|nr:PDZ domain-containing protein [Xanthobacteraceae bacterium]